MVATEDGGLTYTRQIVLCNLLDVVYLFFNPFVTVIPTFGNQSIDLQSKSMDWFLYDDDLGHERVKHFISFKFVFSSHEYLWIAYLIETG